MADAGEDIDVRDAFFDVVYNAAREDRRIMALANDQGAFGVERLKRDFPDQYINVGVAEQNIINVAAGLASGGMRPLVYGITNFMSLRCCEQIAVSLCYPCLPVVIVASGGGLTYASDGPTHHAVQDIGVLRTMPNLTIYNPSDAALTRACARACLASSRPTYVRIEKGVLPALHSSDVDPGAGFALLQPGSDVLVISTGFLMHEAARVVGLLSGKGIRAGLLDLFRLKPVDADALAGVLSEYGRIVTMEEQTPVGGIGSLVAEAAAGAGLRIELKRFSLPDEPCYRYGSREWLGRHLGINSDAIASQIARWDHPHYRAGADGLSLRLAEEDFAALFNVSRGELPAQVRSLITARNFRYRKVSTLERERLLLRAMKALTSGLSVSGPERISAWEKGWRENLDQFVASHYDPACLIPKFVKKKEYVRFRGDYILPSSADFETDFVTVLREFLFRRYFADYGKVCEFGVGTGHNLVALARIFPEKELVGLDWAQASHDIVSKVAEVYHMNLKAVRFDMLHPEPVVDLGAGSAVLTIGAMEQLGVNFEPFLDFLLENRVGTCVNVETIYELYDQEDIFDYVAARYLEKRGYLRGYLASLRALEASGRIEILAVQKTFGSFFHDGYTFIAWKTRRSS